MYIQINNYKNTYHKLLSVQEEVDTIREENVSKHNTKKHQYSLAHNAKISTI